jgi:uncharacterized protein (DUF885 family)
VPIISVLTLLTACKVEREAGGTEISERSAPGLPAFSKFVDVYFDSTFATSPTWGTAAGLHQYDNSLDDFAATTMSKRIATLHSQQSQLDSLLATGKLSFNDSIDAAMIDGAIKSELLDKETMATWKTNPINYVSLPGGSVDGLMKRDFAPPAERLKSVIARLRAAPTVLAEMRANVTDPPREFTDLAIRVAGGSVGFLNGSVASWAKDAAGNDTATLREFTAVNDSAAMAMQAAATWLKSYLLPRSHGSFAIGAKNFSDKLKYDEMVDIPLDRLLAIGEADMKKNHDAFVATAAIVAPGKTPAQAMALLETDHPTAAQLVPTVAARVAGARQFLVDHHIVDIPSEVMPKVQETPPYARVGSFASMDSPGAYETKATEAFFYVTPPEKNWTPEHVEQHLRTFNQSFISMVTVHEVFPGHYLQFLYSKQFPTKTRKLLGSATNIEGWAHYGEQMMVDEGFGNGDPKVRLAQLQAALLRDCRYIVGIKEHTQGMSVQDGADKYFVDQCFMTPASAYEEARRGAYNPTYLYYTLGKLEILKLRADYKQAKGDSFTLAKFHDDFVKQGGVPIKLIRRIMLPGDTASVL